MTFDNSKTIIGMRIRLFAATIIFLAWLALAYVARLINFPFLGMSDTFWTVIFAAVYLFIAFFPMIFRYQYIFYSDDNERIILRYFTAGLIGGRKNSVEIEKRLFAGYKTDSRLLGLIYSITLFQKATEGVAKYPAIYISALSREQRNKIVRSLNSFIPQA